MLVASVQRSNIRPKLCELSNYSRMSSTTMGQRTSWWVRLKFEQFVYQALDWTFLKEAIKYFRVIFDYFLRHLKQVKPDSIKSPKNVKLVFKSPEHEVVLILNSCKLVWSLFCVLQKLVFRIFSIFSWKFVLGLTKQAIFLIKNWILKSKSQLNFSKAGGEKMVSKRCFTMYNFANTNCELKSSVWKHYML